jgi:hypothetical protein
MQPTKAFLALAPIGSCYFLAYRLPGSFRVNFGTRNKGVLSSQGITARQPIHTIPNPAPVLTGLRHLQSDE